MKKETYPHFLCRVLTQVYGIPLYAVRRNFFFFFGLAGVIFAFQIQLSDLLTINKTVLHPNN
jgi:hypothetical protein